MSPVGHALHTLRILSGLSLSDVARRASLDERRVRKAERGDSVELPVLQALSGVYGVDPTYLVGEQRVAAFDGTASLFLFSGDVRDVAIDDLPVVAAALHRARAHAKSDSGLAGVRTRLERPPSAPSGPRPRDAAIQGHVLARDLRAALAMDLEQPVAFHEVLPRLGIVATSARLTSETLRALAILDRDRAAAAIVLNDRVGDPRARLHRVALAHELCHLVYDPISADTCTLTIDELREGGGGHDLRESRARGFAAEFLLPSAGLRALLGPPARVTSEKEAARLVDRARTAYATSWEITVNHLCNLGFHGRGPWPSVRSPASRETVDYDTAEVGLSEPAAMPDEAAAVEHARAARVVAIEVRRSIHDGWRAEAHAVIVEFKTRAAEAPMSAAVWLAAELDRAFERGRSGLVHAVLQQLQPDDVDGDAMVGVLASVRRPCEVFGDELSGPYRVLVGRTKDALSRTWGWSPEDVAGAMDVLG